MHDDTPDFAPWYEANHRPLVAAMRVLCHDDAVAEDIAAEAFVRALERWPRVRAMESPVGWLHRVGLNLVRRRARRATLQLRVLARLAPVVTHVDPPAGEVWLVVSTLPERQRTAVVLRHVARLTEAEIAEAMGVGRSTVSSTLRDAHRSLHKKITTPEMELDHA
ncbi:MAG TPA: sigma-70 family RNA polymerase sigma factor [Iamia sp.]|jgi:RNA polymerase sigma-70 factor (ECF subfamily)|nr:sigma-70 family RNA polymerase sigma factor [Iamia sp.]